MASLGFTVGGVVGIALSAGFVYLEVGRYAAPQVPKSRFDETKELVAYVLGLLAGVPLTFAWLFFAAALLNSALLAAILDVVLLVVGGDIAQTVLLRTKYFGGGSADPFYALGLRAGIGGVLAIGTVSQYFGENFADPLAAALPFLQAIALVLIQVAIGLRGLLPTETASAVIRQRVATLVLAVVLFGATAAVDVYGAAYGVVGALIAIGGASFLYWDARPTVLEPRRLGSPSGAADTRFGRVKPRDRQSRGP